MATVLGEPE